MVSEILAIRMNEEVAGQLHSNTMAIQDAQAARIWELEKQVDGMGTIIHALRKTQESMGKALEACEHQSVMCQALLTHYVESHWVPISNLLEQIGGRSVCGLFPTAPHYCDLHDGETVTMRADGSPYPSSLPSLESASSSSIDSVYYTPAFLQSAQGSASFMVPEVVPFVIQRRSTTPPTLSPLFPGDTGPFGFSDQGVVNETGLTGFPLLGDEGWSSGGSGSDAVGSVGAGH